MFKNINFSIKMGNSHNSKIKSYSNDELIETEQWFEKLATMYINCSGDNRRRVKELNDAKNKISLELEKFKELASSIESIIKQRDVSILLLKDELALANALLVGYSQNFS